MGIFKVTKILLPMVKFELVQNARCSQEHIMKICKV